MADQQNRGGQKQGSQNPNQPETHKHVAAPTDKSQPGHAQSGGQREEYLKETKEQR